jgi:hypothetical protein
LNSLPVPENTIGYSLFCCNRCCSSTTVVAVVVVVAAAADDDDDADDGDYVDADVATCEISSTTALEGLKLSKTRCGHPDLTTLLKGCFHRINRFGDDGAKALAEALPAMSLLEVLSFRHVLNPPTPSKPN